ncbi:MAG: hypothetical protein H6697_03020 [Myxococcales bacterium]|nr:hypothetical protein [Myxococcales bacterium]
MSDHGSTTTSGSGGSLPAFRAALAAAIEAGGPLDVVAARAATVDDTEAARLWLSVAEVWLRDDRGARATAYGNAADRAWSRPDLFTLLERAAADGGDVGAARAFLEVRAHRAESAVERADAWEGVARARARSGEVEGAVAAWVTVAETLSSRTQDALAGLDALVGPREVIVAAKDRIARASGDARAMLRVAEERRAAEADPSSYAAASIELARLSLQVTGDVDDALRYVDDAWGAAPQSRAELAQTVFELAAARPAAGAWARARDYGVAAERWDLAAESARRGAELSPRPDARAELLLQAADLRADRLGDRAGALDCLELAAATGGDAIGHTRARLEEWARDWDGPERDRAWGMLRHALEHAGDWGALHSLISAGAAAQPDPARRAAALAELAHIEGRRMGRPDLEVGTLARLLGGVTTGPASDAARARLASLLDADAVATAAARALFAAGRGALDGAAWARTLSIVAPELGDRSLAADTYDELAGIREADGAVDAAIEALRAAEALAPTAGRGARLRALLGQAGRHDEVVAALQSGSTGGTADARALHLELVDALVASGRREDALRALLDLGTDADAAATARLGALLADEGGVDAALAVAATLVRGGDAARARDLAWMAAQARGLRTEEGLRAGIAALAAAPLEERALGQLHTAAERQGADALVSMLRARLATAPPAELDAARLGLAAAVTATQPHEAWELAAAVATGNPESFSAYARLLAIARVVDEPARVAWALEGLVASSRDADPTAWLEELLELYEGPLSDADGLTSTAQTLLERDATNATALAALERRSAATGDPRVEYGVLASIRESAPSAARVPLDRRLQSIAILVGRPDIAADHALALAASEELDGDTRHEAALAAVELAFGASSPELVKRAFLAVWPLTPDEGRDDRAEEIVDRVGEISASTAAEIAALAADREGAGAGVLDRAAQLALARGERGAARSFLTRWWISPEQLPADRVAQLAVLDVEAASGDSAEWAAAAHVLSVDPQNADVGAAVAAAQERGVSALPLVDLIRHGVLDDADRAALHGAAEVARRESPEAAEAVLATTLERFPDDARAFALLFEAAEARSDSEAQIRLLRDRLPHVDEAARVDLLRRLALLATGDAAETALLELLDVDLADLDAREQLARLYADRGEPVRAADLLEESLELCDDAGRRAALATRAADLAMTAELPARCAALLERALEATPESGALAGRLVGLYEAAGDAKALAAALSRTASLEDDDDAKARTWRRIAEIKERDLADRAGALDALETLLTIEPGNLTVFEEIARLHEESGDWESVVRTFERMAAVGAVQGLREELLLRAAPILLSRLGRPGDAFDMLAAYCETAMPEPPVIRAARVAAARAERWLGWAGTAKRIVERLDDERAPEWLDQGTDWELRDFAAEAIPEVIDAGAEGAAADAVREAPIDATEAHAPSDADPLGEAGTAADDGSAQTPDAPVEVGEALATVEAQGAAAALDVPEIDGDIEVDELDVDVVVPPAPPSPAGAPEHQDHASPPDSGEPASDAGAAGAPEAGTSRQGEYAPRTAREVLEIEIGHVLDEKLGEPVSALRWLASCVARRPSLSATLETLESIAARTEREADLVDTYKQIAAAAGEDFTALWHSLEASAAIAERRLGHPEVAFGIYARAAETPALRAQADRQLRRLAETHGLWADYRSQLADAPLPVDADAVDALVERARIEEEHLGDWQAAFETLLEAAQDAPFDERIRTPLARLADANSAWPFIARLFEVMQADASPADRVRFLGEIADIYGDKLAQPADAFSQQLRAWQLAPTDAVVRARLEARAAAADRRVDLLAAYEWLARQPGEDSAAVAAAVREAASLALGLGLHHRAAAQFVRLGAVVGAGDALAAFAEADAAFSAAGERAHSVDVAGLIADGYSTTDPALASALRLAAAAVASELGDGDAAIEELAAAAAVSGDRTVRGSYLDALRGSEHLDRLARELEADASRDDDGAFEAATELRSLYAERLGLPAQAIAIARRAVALRSEDAEAVEALHDLLGRFERWPDLVDDLLARAEAAPEPEAAAALRMRAAVVLEESLDDSRRACRIAESVLQDSPSHRGALEVRARTLATLGRWSDLIDALDALAQALPGADAGAVYEQQAEVFELQLVRSDRAIDAWRKAAEVDPAAGRPLAQQGRLLAESGALAEAAGLYEQAVGRFEAAGDSLELAEALVALAALVQRGAADLDAVELLARAVELAPNHPVARARFEDALVERGDSDRLLVLLDEEFERATTDAERADVLHRRAAVLLFDAASPADALKAVSRAIELGAGRGAHALLGDVHLAATRWPEAIAEYRLALGADEQVDAATTLPPRALLAGEAVAGHDASVVYLTRAAYALEAAGRGADAWDMYASANLEDDGYGPAIVGLARLALRRGNPEGAATYVASFKSTGPHPDALYDQIREVEASL